jgi:hypothetical protein
MSISKWLDQSSGKSAKNYDVVIVGGGIAGLSTAYWLQKKDPALKIALIEKNRIGFGASGRNAGFVTCGSTEHFINLENDFGLEKALEIWRFSEENHRLLKSEIIQDQGDSIDYRRTGSCTVAPSEQRWELYRSTAATMKRAGLAVREITPQEMENGYGVQGFAGGIHYAGDGYVNPLKLLNLLRSKLAIDIFEGTEVFAIQNHQDHGAVHSDQAVFRADKIILTLNAYLPLLEEKFSNLITPGRGQILMTEPLPPFVEGPCYLTKHLAYFRQLPTGELLVGGFRNLAKDIENTYVDATTPLIQEALFGFIKDHFKFGSQAKIAYQWSGIMAFSPDDQMILGSDDDRPRIQMIAGCSGHGMGLSFHAAKKLVASFYGEALPEHLSLKRFIK